MKREKSKSIPNALGRTLRLIDIAMDQIKLLRVRTLHNFFEKNPKSGLYIRIGQYYKELNSKFDLRMITQIKTSLFVLSDNEYDELVRYGGKITSIGFEKWYK